MSVTHGRFGLIVVLVAACSTGQEVDLAPAPVFGTDPGPCGVTVLSNDVDDQATLAAAVSCAIAEVDAERAFTWDLLVPTVEGDPILHRFVGSGDGVIMTIDTTRDSFGSPSVLVQVCDTIDDTGFVPVGVDCTDSTGVPFELPGDVWPP